MSPAPIDRVMFFCGLKKYSTHGTKALHPPLHNVEVDFLPPHTTSKLQLLYAGVIVAGKLAIKSTGTNYPLISLKLGQ